MHAAPATAASNRPAPTATPSAPLSQRVAAVVSPRTLTPIFRIAPAPMNPMPVATWAATREGSMLALRSNSGKP